MLTDFQGTLEDSLELSEHTTIQRTFYRNIILDAQLVDNARVFSSFCKNRNASVQ